MMRKLLACLLPALLGACVNLKTTVPENYKGPLAVIRDSAVQQSGSKANIFYLSAIDGQRIQDSLIATRQGNAGRGFALGTTVIERPVLPQAGVFKIYGRTEYGAPIQAMLGTVYEVSGDVRFTPEADKHYTVRGQLGEGYSAVWIEDDQSHTVVGEKVEVKGAAKLGPLEK